MKRIFFMALLYCGLAAGQPATPISDKDVRIWASSCAACHGTHGKAEGAGFTLAGKPYKELYSELSQFKSGAREGAVMSKHVRGYSDDELKAIAQFFSNMK